MDKSYVIYSSLKLYFKSSASNLFHQNWSPLIDSAMFFNSEVLCYKYMQDNPQFFSDNIEDNFYEIKCIVIAFRAN